MSNKNIFVCTECGNKSLKWVGKCPDCNQWNTMIEELAVKKTPQKTTLSFEKSKPTKLKDIEMQDYIRIKTGFNELDRVLGGGIVPGSVVLIGGDPGIGKSTLLLQMCKYILKEETILYVTAEESDKQIKSRADRIQVENQNVLIYAENNLDIIEDAIVKTEPQIIIIDSIQTMFRSDISSAPGSVSQVREVTSSLVNIAKNKDAAIFIIGHVTKDGGLAGPKVLEHLVDTVLYFESEKYETYRILRTIKNRYGSTNEIGVFEMKEIGFEEVENPSLLFMSDKPILDNGCAITCILEGTRAVLSEVQALVTTSTFGNPRRTSTGLDYNRISLITAVLEKKYGYRFGDQDIYINVVGGLKIDDRASDLSVAIAIVSSFKNMAMKSKIAMFGEISLTGEIRMVSNIERRIQECEKLGFDTVIIPKINSKLSKTYKIKILQVNNVLEAIQSSIVSK